MATRIRIDRMIVERGLVESREKAAKLIMAGDVFVDGERVDKAGALISPEAEVELRGRSPYVSRGGEKLTHALDHFNINVVGKICIDVGASSWSRRTRARSTRASSVTSRPWRSSMSRSSRWKRSFRPSSMSSRRAA